MKILSKIHRGTTEQRHQLVEMDLFEAGFDVDWQEIEVPIVDWEGVRRSYWNVNKVSSSYNVSSAMVIRALRETNALWNSLCCKCEK